MIRTNIEKFRREAGLTQQQLAEMLGVSDGAISLWENRKTQPKTSVTLMMVEIFRCKPTEILGYEEIDENVNVDKCANQFTKPSRVVKNAKKLTETSTIDKSAKPRRRTKPASSLAEGWED